jgi:hypothetical protein
MAVAKRARVERAKMMSLENIFVKECLKWAMIQGVLREEKTTCKFDWRIEKMRGAYIGFGLSQLLSNTSLPCPKVRLAGYYVTKHIRERTWHKC